ncbi:MAG: hypothetical protein WBZ35_27910 [Pseudolabrys sp.]
MMIEDLVPSFRAAVASEVSKHRQFNGDLNTVEFFARAVTAHRTHYSQKLERIRFEHPEARAEPIHSPRWRYRPAG